MADTKPNTPNNTSPPEGETAGYFGELARAYVPPQRYSQVWGPAEGLMKGTIFPELYRTYEPGMRP
ncbi:MAG: spore coat associated protein CotJA [Bacillota bacterium]|nr:spore coat associated protein CotJA [Bacillota bacterium]MDI6639144.1 spore coat associated protein CotJA [Bacillota bacterium]